MKRSKKKHQQRCNGRLILDKTTTAYKLYICNKCGWETRYYRKAK